MTNYKMGERYGVRLSSCQIARKSQGFRHVILLAIFLCFARSKETNFNEKNNLSSDSLFQLLCDGLISFFLLWMLNPIATTIKAKQQKSISKRSDLL